MPWTPLQECPVSLENVDKHLRRREVEDLWLLKAREMKEPKKGAAKESVGSLTE